MTITTINPVEATSLASVTSVAVDPPLHPGEPTQVSQLPLTLYIARVPGSRDVFLTPLKPRERVVTAEDVQSSLYYIHVNCAEDYEADTTSAAHARAIPSIAAKATPPLLPQRPAAPNVPPYPVDDLYAPVAPPPLPDQPARIGIRRKPVGISTRNADDDASALPVLPPRPRPLPAIPVDEQPYVPSLYAEKLRLLRHAEDTDEHNPYHPKFNPPAFHPSQIDPADRPASGTLTLIRRDPSSHEQWNVAFIRDPPIHEISSAALLSPSAASRTKDGGAPLYMDITNPAYQRFLKHDSSSSRTSTSTTASSDSDPAPEGIFRRRLYMPGSRFSQHGYGHHRRFGSADASSNSEDSSMRRTMRRSVDLSTHSDAPSPVVADRRTKGYSFSSPWGSHCEFTTTPTGRSLKCRHHMAGSHFGAHSATVSELRFNLPTVSSSTKGSTMAEKRSSYFQGMHRRLGSTDSSSDLVPRAPTFVIDEEGRIDLSLGQEKAGGGFGGRQAKLGKLIIEPEGMKMLDLLVAANVGLWWRVYERN